MSQTFTKLFAGITESTVWCEPDRTRLVWITMLAMADQYGRVSGSVPGLANRARVPLEDARLAIAAFLAPDPDSRTKDHEGRRIEEIDGGWRLLNHAKYRELRSEDDRREQNRLAQARHRARQKPAAGVSTRQQSKPRSAQAEAEAEAEAEAKKEIPVVPDLFETFWSAYPRKVAKEAARKVFVRLKADVALVRAMVQAIELQGLNAKCLAGESRFVCHASTWLTDRRWEDQASPQSAAADVFAGAR